MDNQHSFKTPQGIEGTYFSPLCKYCGKTIGLDVGEVDRDGPLSHYQCARMKRRSKYSVSPEEQLESRKPLITAFKAIQGQKLSIDEVLFLKEHGIQIPTHSIKPTSSTPPQSKCPF